MVHLPKQPVVRGHPLHAMLSDFPIGLLPAAFVAAAAARGEPRGSALRRSANALAGMAFAAGAGAATAGVWDWFAIPRSHPAWWPATVHGVLNLTTVAALGTAAARPERRLPIYGAVAAAYVVSGWLGGELVFAHGWRVKPAEVFEQLVDRLDAERDGPALSAARDVVDKYEREETFLPA